MLAHGVPANQTAWLQERLGIQSLADLAGLNIIHVVRVPRWLRGRFIRLRHAHCPPDAVWERFANLDSEENLEYWEEYDAAELQRLADVVLGTVEIGHQLLNFVNAHANDSDTEVFAVDNDEDSDASTSTASTANMPNLFDSSSDADNGAEDDEVAYE